MSERIDSHQHFWRYRREDYDWIDDGMTALRADFLPQHLRPLLQHNGIDGCIAVQARQALVETRWLLQLAAQNPWIRGVVGWVDLQAEDVEVQLREFDGEPALVGVRHIAQDEPAGFLQGSGFRRGLTALAARGLVYDLLLRPSQLPAATELVTALPQLTFVLDHLAKPMVARSARQPWADDLTALARLPNVHCKLSGLATEAEWSRWSAASLQPYFEVALAAFGPERLLFGSDWPVCTLASSYRRWCDTVHEWLQPLQQAQRQAVLGDNAARVYRLGRLS